MKIKSVKYFTKRCIDNYIIFNCQKSRGQNSVINVPNPCREQMNYNHLFSFNHGSQISYAWLGNRLAALEKKNLQIFKTKFPILKII